MNPLNATALAICGGQTTFGFTQFVGGLSLWAAFVAWASFFHGGGTPEKRKLLRLPLSGD